MEERIASPTERGQITIPKELRERLNIDHRTKMKVYLEDNRIILEPVSSQEKINKAGEVIRDAKGALILAAAIENAPDAFFISISSQAPLEVQKNWQGNNDPAKAFNK